MFLKNAKKGTFGTPFVCYFITLEVVIRNLKTHFVYISFNSDYPRNGKRYR